MEDMYKARQEANTIIDFVNLLKEINPNTVKTEIGDEWAIVFELTQDDRKDIVAYFMNLIMAEISIKNEIYNEIRREHTLLMGSFCRTNNETKIENLKKFIKKYDIFSELDKELPCLSEEDIDNLSLLKKLDELKYITEIWMKIQKDTITLFIRDWSKIQDQIIIRKNDEK